MGLTIEVNSLEEMCMLMCDNVVPRKEDADECSVAQDAEVDADEQSEELV